MIQNSIKLALRNVIVCLTMLWVCDGFSIEKHSSTESVAELMRRGVSAEKNHQSATAAQAYEQLLQHDTTFEATVAPRLVNLYISMNRPASALSWARRIARHHPEPKAYLAGVHSRLNQNKEAELLLRQALRKINDPTQRTPLLWQLAQTLENQGDNQGAMTTLENARDTANNAAMRQTATRRIKALQKRVETTHRIHKHAIKPTEEQP